MEPSGCKVVAYRRVSTKRQGDSGLGLEGQDEAIRSHVKANGCRLLATYTEVESGKLSTRPELLKALAHARRSRAVLVIAKLDRLSRNVHFLSGLMESKVEFVACDNPHATPLTIHILAAVAEYEAKAISDRTKAALAMAKVRGVKLGRNNLTPEGTRKGLEASALARRSKAVAAYSDLAPLVREWRKVEGLSQQAIADRLNREGHETRKFRPWNQVQVKRILNRMGVE